MHATFVVYSRFVARKVMNSISGESDLDTLWIHMSRIFRVPHVQGAADVAVQNPAVAMALLTALQESEQCAASYNKHQPLSAEESVVIDHLYRRKEGTF